MQHTRAVLPAIRLNFAKPIPSLASLLNSKQPKTLTLKVNVTSGPGKAYIACMPKYTSTSSPIHIYTHESLRANLCKSYTTLHSICVVMPLIVHNIINMLVLSGVKIETLYQI